MSTLARSNTISEEDINLFMSVTRKDENFAKVFLHKFPDVSTAIRDYFSAKELNPSPSSSPKSNEDVVKPLDSTEDTSKSSINDNSTVANSADKVNLKRTPRRSNSKISVSKDTMDVEGDAIVKALIGDIQEQEEQAKKMDVEESEGMQDEDDEQEDDEVEDDNDDELIPEEKQPASGKSSSVKYKIADDAAQFMAFTGTDQDTANKYLLRYKDVFKATDAYFARTNNEDFSADEQQANVSSSVPNFKVTSTLLEDQVSNLFGAVVSGSQALNNNRNNYNVPRFNRRGKKKDRRNREPPAPIQIGSSESVSLKLKGSYDGYMKKFLKGQALKDNTVEWPKYLGSLIVDCRVTEWYLLSKMKLHDKLTFEPQNIEFNNVKSRRSRKENGVKVYDTIDSWYVKGKSLDVRCYWKDKFVGFLSCENEEAFVFLLKKNYLILDGTIVVCSDIDDTSSSKYKGLSGNIKVQMDVFLTDEVIKNPLNVITTHPGRKTKSKKNKQDGSKEEVQSKEEQQAFQILKLTKESFVKVFHMLRIAVSIPTLVQLRQRIDPFQRIKKEKYGTKVRRRSIMMPMGAPAEVITSDFKSYYASEKSVANLPVTTPKKKKTRSRVLRDFDEESDEDDEDFNSEGIDNDLSDGNDDDEDFDAEEYDGLIEDSNNIQTVAVRKYDPFNSNQQRGVLPDSEQSQPPAENNGKEPNQDILTTEKQIASYYKAAEPPSSLKSELHAYQKQALSWMLYREGEIGEEDLFDVKFDEQRRLNDLFQEMKLLNGSKLYFNPFNGEISVEFPNLKACKGGILADEMGLGKTVMTIALLHSNKRQYKPTRTTVNDSEDEQEEEEDSSEEESEKSDENEEEEKEEKKSPQRITRSKSSTTKDQIDQKRTLKDFFSFRKSPAKLEEEKKKKDDKKDGKWVMSEEEWDLSDEEENKKAKTTKKVKLENGYKESVKPNDEKSASDKGKKPPRRNDSFLMKKHSGSESRNNESDEDDENFLVKRKSISSGRGKSKNTKQSKSEKKTAAAKKKPTKKTAKKAEKKKTTGGKQMKKAGTLIAVPLTVLSQWENEIKRHSKPNTLSVHQYYGGGRKREELDIYDVVLTTYGILESEYAKRHDKRDGLFGYDWYRVILDEAHYIKSRVTSTSKAANSLQSKYRWCLTGTPLQNKLDDMFSLLQFLKVDTWGEYFWWNTYINKYTSTDEAANLIRGILKPMILRRTKKSTYLDGRNILELPPKEIKTNFVKLTQEERAIYNCFFQKSSQQFNDMVKGGTIQYEYAHVFELLIRLRQVCNHPSLVFSKEDLKDRGSLESAVYKFLEKRLEAMKESVAEAEGKREEKKKIKEEAKQAREKKKKERLKKQKRSDDDDDDEMDEEEAPEKEAEEEGKENPQMKSEFIQKTIERLKNKDLEPCCICLDEILDPVISNCGHIYCRECLTLSLKASKKCPLCQKEISAKDVMSLAMENPEHCRDLLDINCATFKKSSKLTALVETIQEVKERGEKCVIFSQFLGMLNLVQRFIGEADIKYTRVDGSSSMQARMKNIDSFINNKETTVILISLKAGAIGLNLTAANNVFLIDPWWNPAVEDQAIERVHRIGQSKKVNVVRFVCEKTIEERIVQLNEQKKVLINNILQFNPQEQKKQNIQNMIYVMQGFDE